MNKQNTNEISLFLKKEYQIIGLLEDDLEAIYYLEELLSSCEVSEGTFDDNEGIVEIMKSIADKFVPFDSNDFWKNVSSLEPYINEVISETGQWNMKDTTLSSLVHDGYFEYYKELLYQNVETVLYNIIVYRVNYLLSKQSNQIVLAIQSHLAKIEEVIKNAAYFLENEMSHSFDVNVLYKEAEGIIESAIADLDEFHTA